MAEQKGAGFADLLDGTFKLISRTWTTSLFLGAVLFIPTSVLFGWAYSSFMDAIRSAAETARGDQGALLAGLGLGYLWIALAALAQGVVFLFVRACVTAHAVRAARGEPTDTLSVVVLVIRRTYAPLLGQRVLQVVILSITLAGVSLVVGVVVGVAAAFKMTLVAVLAGSILGAAGLALFVWISVRYMVSLESLVIDGTGIEQSIDASMTLVRHRWWRVFGYTLLLGLMVSFASSLIGTPIMFFSTIRQLLQGLESVLRDTSGSHDFNAVVLRLLAVVGRRLGILQYVQSLLAVFVLPVFMTLLFLELKRQHEQQASQAAPPAGQ